MVIRSHRFSTPYFEYPLRGISPDRVRSTGWGEVQGGMGLDNTYAGIERALSPELRDFVQKNRNRFDGPVDTPEELRLLMQMLQQSEGALTVPHVPEPKAQDGGLGSMSPQDLLQLLIQYLTNLQQAERPRVRGTLGSPPAGWLGGDRSGGRAAPPAISSRAAPGLPSNVEQLKSVQPGKDGVPPGLRPNAARGAKIVREVFGFRGTIGGVGHRAGKSDHPHGNAIDVMTNSNKQLGQNIADYFVKNRAALGVKYVIFNQRIASPRTGWQWNKMRDRGSATKNHLDHPHISFV